MRKTARGFTLVELLVVIAIIVILAAVVVLVVNPLELTRRSRDAARLADLANLHQAINIAVQEATDSAASVLCSQGGTTCTESSFTIGTNTRKSDGSGWVKVNLSSQQAVSVPTLPIDPTNNSTYKYTYFGGNAGWEINAALESTQYSPKMADTADGGNCPTKYEIGSNLGLLTC